MANVLTITRSGDSVTFRVRVAPRASRSSVNGVHDGALKVSLTAPPVDGAANAALVSLLAELLDLPKRAVEISHGHEARLKTVRVTGTTEEAVRALVPKQ